MTEEVKAPEITVAIEDAGTLKKKVTVTVPAERITTKRDEMFGELNDSAQVPGFRVGRAPRRLLEKKFGKDIAQDVRNSIVGETIGEAMEDNDIKSLGEPDLKLDDVVVPEEGDLEYTFEVEVEPEFDLPELKGIKLTKTIQAVDDTKIDDYIKNIVEGQAKYEKTEDAAAEGDSIVASAKITGEDIEFENPRVMVRVAASYVEGIALPDLADDLKGKKAGDVVTVKVTVPDTHAKEDWQGKEVSIELTINEVSSRILPEINDEFASKMGFDKLEELKEYVGERLVANQDAEAQQGLRQQVCDYLLEKCDFEMPEGIVKRQTAHTLQRQMVQMMQMGIPQEKLMERRAEMEASAQEEATKSLKVSFVLGKIAEKEDIQINEDEVNARISQMAMQYGRRPERMRQELAADGTINQLAQSILEEKAVDKLLEAASVEEVAAEEKKAPAKKKAAKKTAKKAAKKTAKKAAKKEEKTEE